MILLMYHEEDSVAANPFIDIRVYKQVRLNYAKIKQRNETGIAIILRNIGKKWKEKKNMKLVYKKLEGSVIEL